MSIIRDPSAEKNPGNNPGNNTARDRDPLILNRQQAARLLLLVERLVPYKRPLFEAVANGSIMLCEVPRGAPFPRHTLGNCDRPMIALIGDDDGAPPVIQ